MRNLKLLSLLVIVALFSCKKESGITIKGTWDNGAGKIVYLKALDSTSNFVTVDSAVVGDNGSFVITRPSSAQMIPAKLSAERQNISLLLYNLDKPIEVEITSNEVKVLKRGATDSTTMSINNIKLINAPEEIESYQKGEAVMTSSGLVQLGTMMMLMDAQQNGKSLDSVMAIKEEMTKELEKSIVEYVDSSKNCRASTFFIKDFVLKQRSLKEAKVYYEQLSPQVKNSIEGKNLLQAIEVIEKYNVGGTPDNFSLPAPDGKEVSLESFRGKILIVDFWASWCAPCLAETPNLKKIYEKWHGKGLEILGISLDKAKDREKWINAINNNNLAWTQVSSLKGWECPVARMFNVTAIPRMYILDVNGKIIAQDLRGEELALKVDSLLSDK